MQSAAQQGPRKTGPQRETHNPDRPSTRISNRYTKLLESTVTCTKQTTDLRSNRYKNPFSPPRSLSSRVAFVGPPLSRAQASENEKEHEKEPKNDRRYRANGARNTPGHLARHSFTLRNKGSLTTGHCFLLIANDMHSPANATNSQRATYDLLIANEFQLQNAIFGPVRLWREKLRGAPRYCLSDIQRRVWYST